MKKGVSLIVLLLAVSFVSAEYHNGIFLEKPTYLSSSSKLKAGPSNSASLATNTGADTGAPAGNALASSTTAAIPATPTTLFSDKVKTLGATFVGNFMLMNRDTGKVLEAITTGTHETLVLSTSSGARSQIFTIYNSDAGYYIFAANGHALTLDNFGAGNVLIFTGISKKKAQTWSFTPKIGDSWGAFQSTLTKQAVASTIASQNVLTVFPTRLAANPDDTQMFAMIKINCL